MEFNGPNFSISHVEFVTIARLGGFVTEYLKDRVGMESIFPQQAIESEEADLRMGR
jgi:hypothetical protein